MNSLSCSYAAVCAGCDWLLIPQAEQRARKTEHLRGVWRTAGLGELDSIEWIGIAPGGLRDRVDLMIETVGTGRPKLGLFDRFHTGLVDLEGCPQLSPALEAWFQEFRRLPMPKIKRGSLRLRVSPSGRRGVWIDFSNVDIKTLLDERTTLDSWRANAVVEIGQKRKRLIEREGRLKLEDPVLEAWFETRVANGSHAPIFTTIGSFTQPGFRAGEVLASTVEKIVQPLKPKRVVEFGAGSGFFTLPLASLVNEVVACEIDATALEGLRRSLEETGLRDKVKIESGDFQNRLRQNFEGVDMIFVDPPRSGLKGFLQPLEELGSDQRAKHLVYVSCFAESFAADSARLLDIGYRVESLAIVDQFPQSRHYEVVAHFTRD